VSRKPIERSTAVTDPGSSITGQPLPPLLPSIAFVIPPSPQAVCQTSPAEKLVLAQPAVRVKTSAAVEGTLASQRKMSSRFGNAPDYSWLEGVLEIGAGGPAQLRFAESSTLDTWGGRVSLENDSRLLALRNGDVILVTGAMLAAQDKLPYPTDHVYPLYRIDKIWLIQRPEQ
jgi:hypothetical protein